VITYTLELDDKQVNASLVNWEKHIPGLHNLVLNRITHRMAGNAQEYFLSGQALHVGTGLLRQGVFTRKVDDFEYAIGDKMVYAQIHETGGVITAKNAKNLAIPIDPMARGKSPRSIAGLFFTMRGRTKFLALRPMFSRVPYQTKTGKTRYRTMGNEAGVVKLMYLLKPSVTMPKRPYMSAAIDYTVFSGEAGELAALALDEHIKKFWEVAS
jgi:phage gpG-like protein